MQRSVRAFTLTIDHVNTMTTRELHGYALPPKDSAARFSHRSGFSVFLNVLQPNLEFPVNYVAEPRIEFPPWSMKRSSACGRSASRHSLC